MSGSREEQSRHASQQDRAGDMAIAAGGPARASGRARSRSQSAGAEERPSGLGIKRQRTDGPLAGAPPPGHGPYGRGGPPDQRQYGLEASRPGNAPRGGTLSSPMRQSQAYSEWTSREPYVRGEEEATRPLTTGSEGLLFDRRHSAAYEPALGPRGSDPALSDRPLYRPGTQYPPERVSYGPYPPQPLAAGRGQYTTAWSSEHPASYDSRLHRRGGSLTLQRAPPPLQVSHMAFPSDRRHTTYPVPGSSNQLATVPRPMAGPPDAGPIRASASTSSVPPPPAESSSSTGPGKTQAVFVNKLYTMLEDPAIQRAGLLRWSDDGMGFICPDPQEFAKNILPQFFKHNNWHSFVRQLNMYGFNKVNDVFQSLNAAPDAPVPWEFRHSTFKRGDPSSIARIKRRSVKSNTAHREQQAQAAAAVAHASALSQYPRSSISGYGERAPTEPYATDRYRTTRVDSEPGGSRLPFTNEPRPLASGWSYPRRTSVSSQPPPTDQLRGFVPRDEDDKSLQRTLPPAVRSERITVSPMNVQGSTFSFQPSEAPTRRQSESDPAQYVAGSLGEKAQDLVRNIEGLSDGLTEAFARIERTRNATNRVLEGIMARLTPRLSLEEEDAVRRDIDELRSAGIYSVQAVSGSLSEATHLSQDILAFVNELTARGLVSQEVSPDSSDGPSPAENPPPEPQAPAGAHQSRDSVFLATLNRPLSKSPEAAKAALASQPRSHSTPPGKLGQSSRQTSGEDAASGGATIRDLLN